MSRMRRVVAPAVLVSALALAACTPTRAELPDPAALDPTLHLADGFSGGVGGLIDPDANPPAHVVIQLDPGTYVLRVACTSADGSAGTVTVEFDGSDAVTHVAACGTVDESDFVAVTTESVPFDAPGGEVRITGTAAAATSFNTAFVATEG